MDKNGYLTKNDLMILKALINKNYYVLELVNKLKIPHKTIKERLNHLKEFKIISYKKKGKKQEHFIIQSKKKFVEQILKVFNFF